MGTVRAIERAGARKAAAKKAGKPPCRHVWGPWVKANGQRGQRRTCTLCPHSVIRIVVTPKAEQPPKKKGPAGQPKPVKMAPEFERLEAEWRATGVALPVTKKSSRARLAATPEVARLLKVDPARRQAALKRCVRIPHATFTTWLKECVEPASGQRRGRVRAAPVVYRPPTAAQLRSDRAKLIAADRFNRLLDVEELPEPEGDPVGENYSPRRTPTGDGPRSRPTGGIARGW